LYKNSGAYGGAIGGAAYGWTELGKICVEAADADFGAENTLRQIKK
jgi:hypothetical protein